MSTKARRVTTVVLVSSLAVALSACGGSREDFEKWKKTKDAEASAAAATATKSKPKTKVAVVELQSVEVAVMGVRLNLPRGSKALRTGKSATTYSYPVDGKKTAIDVSIRAFGETDLEKAKKSATQVGGRVAEARPVDGKLEVVLAPKGILQHVEVYLADRSVQCSGPKTMLAKLREICGSLESTAG